jgi:hypothetical protein
MEGLEHLPMQLLYKGISEQVHRVHS